ncbi:glycosyltransferase [Alkalibacillus haloalkaliphilus]|uniref:glycosyltransferase n=1 Tax=Alkalibacillus haloalkaliphilus TaxID=94136 RepID=UPI0029365077|nr:hypothetical protein [Alkalibacillus haloalkaliphilus]MDV2583348.1 hypothetical protein [Alkalibacillus haloalkaliphilus]
MERKFDHYERNYWSLYLDFLKTFKKLEYKGISLPYLCHFKSLFRKNTELLKNLEKTQIYKQLNHKVLKEGEFQKVFNDFVRKHSKKELNPNKNGKVIFHDVYNLLRFPNNTFEKNFNPSDSLMIIERYKRNPNQTHIPTQYFDEYMSDSSLVKERIKDIEKKAKQIIKRHSNHPMYKEQSFQDVFFDQLTKIIYRIEEAQNLLETVPTACVVVPSAHYFQTRTFVIVAAEKGIPTICMQHGIFSNRFSYLPQVSYIDAVYGQLEKDWLKTKGVMGQRMEVIGHPRFDQIFNGPTKPKSSFQQKLKLDKKKKTILIIIRGKQQLNEWRQFINELSDLDQFNIIIRDYPNVKKHPLIKDFPFLKTTKGFKLYDSIYHSDCVISYSSTVALEAMLAGKPVFLLNKEFPGYSGYFDSLGKLVQEDPSSLAKIVGRYFDDRNLQTYVKEKQGQFLENAYPNRQELSSDRLKQLINRITNK